jgi:hypothetical protein
MIDADASGSSTWRTSCHVVIPWAVAESRIHGGIVVTPEYAPAMSGGSAMADSASTTDNSRNSIPITRTSANRSPMVGMARETELNPITNNSPRPE